MSYTLPDYHTAKPFRVDHDEREDYDQIHTKGLQVKWESAHVCPCSAAESMVFTGATATLTKEPDVDCVACSGSGWLYHSAQTITAQVLGNEVSPDLFAMYGSNAYGMIRLTTQPQHILEHRDRITGLDMRFRRTERKTRAGAVETLAFPVVSFTEQTGTTLDATSLQTVTLDMLHVTAADTSGDIVLDGAAPREYVKGTDFTIDGDGAVDWTGGANVPPLGGVVTYTYLTNPVFLVYNLPFASRQTYVRRKTATAVLKRLPNHADCKLAPFRFPGEAAVSS